MEYIKIKNNNYTKENIQKVAGILNECGVAILPTDTVYGIAVDSMNEEAVKKLFDVKHRQYSQPFSVLVSSIEMMREVAEEISEKEERIINNFFPGAMTIILKKNKKIPDIVTAGLDTIGVRIPDNKFILDLVKFFGRPIVATSLNLPGEKNLTDVDSIPSEIKDKVDVIVDSGEIKEGMASTIVRVIDGEVQILREGPIDIKSIDKILKGV